MPDKRWKPRYDRAMAALDEAISELVEVVACDREDVDAVWQTYALSADGCLEGARSLLMRANEQRDKYIEELQQKTKTKS